MKRKIFTLFAALTITAVSAVSVSAAAPDCCGFSSQTAAITQLEQTACRLVNEERTARGLEPYEISPALSAKARIKAQDMKRSNYFSHTSPAYGSPFAMMQTLGITYRSAAENIAMGYRTAEAVVSAWMASPSHRANLLSTRYDTMGIGQSDGFWAQWFTR